MKRFLLAAALTAGLALQATPVHAAESVTIREVNTQGFPQVSLFVQVSGEAKTTDFALRENGQTIKDLRVVPLKETSKPIGTVLVIDTSGSMKAGGAIDRAKAAARQFIAAKAPNDWIALVAFSSQAYLKSDFTQDGAVLTAAVDSLVADGETALWDGVSQGAALYAKRPELQANILVLSDGADTVSSANETQAVAAVTTAGASLFAIGIQSPEFNPALLGSFVEATGGSLATSLKPEDLSAQFTQVRRAIENQYQVTYTSTGNGGSISLDLTVAGASTRTQTRAGTVGVAPAPTVVDASGGFFGNSSAKWIVVAAVAGAVGLFAFGLMVIFFRKDQDIDRRLGAAYSGAAEEESGSGKSLAETGFVQRAVEVTSKMADRGGLLMKVEALLEQANVPLRPAEALFFYCSGVLLLGLAAIIAAPRLPIGLMVAALVAAGPVLALKFLRTARLKKFEAQLPDTLNLMSGSLRAGYSFLQGLEAVAEETSDPMARELKRVLVESRLGRPLEEALDDTAERMDSIDFRWAVLAIRIQREVGGNLAELLSTVADTMVQRGRLRGEIKALTAEGRISAVVMGLLPIALGGLLYMMNPDYISKLFTTGMGLAMVAGATVMGAVGMLWLKKIIKIEV